ncbi:ATP-binding cassette domain-containing protein [Streptomyces sp. LE64]|uniref:ATP-binding cassette domain-containing protein n=1 Tax=Streptomyces sp. LE64 TaxID=3448653 RepID=UPI0040414B24
MRAPLPLRFRRPAHRPPPGIRLTGVGRRYGRRSRWVLRGVDLTLPPGALVRVHGVNGSGKSTLLRLVAGLDAPTEGRVTGRPHTAYVPERFPPRLPFTALGYLVHLGRVHGLDRSAAERAARHWLERLGAGPHATAPLSSLSKGTCQKVALAQALLAPPGLLVLDEAWSGLDPDAHAELNAAVAERVEAGATVVFVDHRRTNLAGRADLLVTVEKGRASATAEKTGRTGPSGGARPEPRTVIVAEGPAGAEPPPLPAGVRAARTPAGTVRFTTDRSSSDEVLRALLTAPRPWHVVTVHRAGALPAARGPGREDDAVDAPRGGGEVRP